MLVDAIFRGFTAILVASAPSCRQMPTNGVKITNTAGPAENAAPIPALPANQSALQPQFINFAELSRHVPLCERSLREAIRRGQIPSIRLPGGRRVVFHWDSVQAALLRMQRGLD